MQHARTNQVGREDSDSDCLSSDEEEELVRAVADFTPAMPHELMLRQGQVSMDLGSVLGTYLNFLTILLLGRFRWAVAVTPWQDQVGRHNHSFGCALIHLTFLDVGIFFVRCMMKSRLGAVCRYSCSHQPCKRQRKVLALCPCMCVQHAVIMCACALQVLRILKKHDSGWWEGCGVDGIGQGGWFPSNHVIRLPR